MLRQRRSRWFSWDTISVCLRVFTTRTLTLCVIVPLVLQCINVSPCRSGTYTFTPLGTVPNQDPNNEAIGAALSTDGSVAAVSLTVGTLFQSVPFSWTQSNGFVPLLQLPTDPWDGYDVTGISGDGSVVAGLDRNNQTLSSELFQWTQQTGTLHPSNPPGIKNVSYGGMTSDGKTIIASGNAFINGPVHMYQWTQQSGYVDLNAFTASQTLGGALGVSGDGKTIVGSIGSQTVNPNAFYWTNATGVVPLVNAPNVVASGAGLISANGSVIVGGAFYNYNANAGEPTNEPQAFRWTDTGGMAILGSTTAFTSSGATGMSADGSVIVGQMTFNTATQCNLVEPFVWTQATGMVDITSLLTSHGVDLTGWRLDDILGISPDGHTIIGVGYGPTHVVETWIATIPEPTGFSLAAFATLCVAVGLWLQKRGGVLAS
jgi:hypothetical protein